MTERYIIDISYDETEPRYCNPVRVELFKEHGVLPRNVLVGRKFGRSLQFSLSQLVKVLLQTTKIPLKPPKGLAKKVKTTTSARIYES